MGETLMKTEVSATHDHPATKAALATVAITRGTLAKTGRDEITVNQDMAVRTIDPMDNPTAKTKECKIYKVKACTVST